MMINLEIQKRINELLINGEGLKSTIKSICEQFAISTKEAELHVSSVSEFIIKQALISGTSKCDAIKQFSSLFVITEKQTITVIEKIEKEIDRDYSVAKARYKQIHYAQLQKLISVCTPHAELQTVALNAIKEASRLIEDDNKTKDSDFPK